MDKESIIRMAEEAKISFDADGSNSFIFSIDQFGVFTNLIRNHVLEEAAKECESIALDIYSMINTREYGECANAIRAMKTNDY